MHRFITNITGNNYSDIAIGFTHKESSDVYRGCLHRFVKVPFIEMSNESYSNIGGLTLEFLQMILLKIKLMGDESGTGKFTGSFQGFSSLDSATTLTKPVDKRFFTFMYSSCLIFAETVNSLRIYGRNRFSNIWLIDRSKAFSNSDAYMTEQERGLILSLQGFSGRL